MSLDAWRGIRASGRTNATPDSILNTTESAETILPADFLPFGIGPAVVGDGDLVDARTRLGRLRHDLGFKAEAVFLNFDRLDEFASKRFVAGLHVREVEIGRHVRQEREELVAERVPEIQHAVLVRADEAGAKNRIGLSRKDRRDELGILRRIVFEIRILNNNDRPSGGCNRCANRRALP